MKRVLKYAAAAAVLSAVLMLGACGGGERTDKSLYEHGLELAAEMREMAGSRQYIELYSSYDAMENALSAACAGDFSEPEAVYKITVSENGSSLLDMAETDELSDTLRERVRSKILPSVITRINALAGAEQLAAASLCSAGRLFVSRELTEDQIYLYTYENALPVAVTFVMGENGAVSASGMLILYEDFKTDMLDLMGELGLEVEEITEQCVSVK